jgi:hypothetical protein
MPFSHEKLFVYQRSIEFIVWLECGGGFRHRLRGANVGGRESGGGRSPGSLDPRLMSVSPPGWKKGGSRIAWLEPGTLRSIDAGMAEATKSKWGIHWQAWCKRGGGFRHRLRGANVGGWESGGGRSQGSLDPRLMSVSPPGWKKRGLLEPCWNACPERSRPPTSGVSKGESRTRKACPEGSRTAMGLIARIREGRGNACPGRSRPATGKRKKTS